MLQQFESTSNCCNTLPQQNVALKIVRRAMFLTQQCCVKIVVKNRPVTQRYPKGLLTLAIQHITYNWLLAENTITSNTDYVHNY